MTHDGPEALPDKAIIAFGRGQRKWKLPARFLVTKLDHALLVSDYGKGTFLKPALLNICIVDIDSLQDLLIYVVIDIFKKKLRYSLNMVICASPAGRSSLNYLT